MEGWTVKALMRGDECIGAVYFRGDELHVSVVPEWRKRWATRAVLQNLFAAPRVTTRVTPGHEYMHGILQRLGFVQQDDFFVRGASDGN
jgi:RimJ/RimL family protein N-acetyltransferase